MSDERELQLLSNERFRDLSYAIKWFYYNRKWVRKRETGDLGNKRERARGTF